MDPLDLIHLQITLEYQLDLAGNLVPFAGSSEQARYIVYKYSGGYRWYYRYDLPTQVRSQLAEQDPDNAFEQPEQVINILSQDGSVDPSGPFISGYFDHKPAVSEPLQLKLLDGCFVIVVDNRPVAWAGSERNNTACAEVAVETLLEFRRRGFARQVTAAWANHILHQGLVAFYSYHADNLPSQALANSLGVVQYAECMAFT